MPSSCCEMRLRKDRVYYFPASLSTPRKWHCAPPLITLAKAMNPLSARAAPRTPLGAGAGPARELGGPALASPGPRAPRFPPPNCTEPRTTRLQHLAYV